MHVVRAPILLEMGEDGPRHRIDDDVNKAMVLEAANRASAMYCSSVLTFRDFHWVPDNFSARKDAIYK